MNSHNLFLQDHYQAQRFIGCLAHTAYLRDTNKFSVLFKSGDWGNLKHDLSFHEVGHKGVGGIL